MATFLAEPPRPGRITMRGHVMRNCRARNYRAVMPAALLVAFFAAVAAAQMPGVFAGARR